MRCAICSARSHAASPNETLTAPEAIKSLSRGCSVSRPRSAQLSGLGANPEGILGMGEGSAGAASRVQTIHLCAPGAGSARNATRAAHLSAWTWPAAAPPPPPRPPSWPPGTCTHHPQGLARVGVRGARHVVSRELTGPSASCISLCPNSGCDVAVPTHFSTASGSSSLRIMRPACLATWENAGEAHTQRAHARTRHPRSRHAPALARQGTKQPPAAFRLRWRRAEVAQLRFVRRGRTLPERRPNSSNPSLGLGAPLHPPWC